jgi:hypothetical protein
MVSLGHINYEFQFTSYEDMRMAWSMGTVNVKPGVLCFKNGPMILTPTIKNKLTLRFVFDLWNYRKSIGDNVLCLKL